MNKIQNSEEGYLIEQLRTMAFNPGVLRINLITSNLNKSNKQVRLKLFDSFIEENHLKVEDYSIKNSNFKLTPFGLKKLNTEENKKMEFSDNLKLFAKLLIDSYYELIEKRVKSPTRTWNIKLYNLENDFYAYAKNLSDPLFLLKKIFLIQAEEKRNVSWLMEEITAYVKKEIVTPTDEYNNKVLFNSKKIMIMVSLSNKQLVLIIKEEKTHYERPFELKELPIFKNIITQFVK